MDSKQQFINDRFRISQEHYDRGWNMPFPHKHMSYEIYILKSGTRYVTTADKDYTVNACDASLFSSQVPHVSRGNSSFSGICIHFSTQYLKEYFTSDTVHFLLKCFDADVVHMSKEDTEIICKIADEFKPYNPYNFLKLAQILVILRNSIPLKSTSQTAPSSKAEKIIEYVNNNYFYIDTLDTLADFFEVSENYLYKIFKTRFQCTPKTYINKLRIANACRIIEQSKNVTFRKVSIKSGFKSYEHFLKTFKTVMEMTPSEYKKRCEN